MDASNGNDKPYKCAECFDWESVMRPQLIARQPYDMSWNIYPVRDDLHMNE